MTIRRPEAKIDMKATFPGIVAGDFADLMLGVRLGGGIARDVYELNFPPKGMASVIKFEDVAGSFQNIIEWEAWQNVCDTKWEKWFAPCCQISRAGCVLVQRKTTTLQKLPKRVPSFLKDLKESNWGEYEGRPVCHDYGTMAPISVEAVKMVKAVWRDDD